MCRPLGEVVKISKTVTVEVDGEDFEVQPAIWERYRYSYSAATKTLIGSARRTATPSSTG